MNPLQSGSTQNVLVKGISNPSLQISQSSVLILVTHHQLLTLSAQKHFLHLASQTPPTPVFPPTSLATKPPVLAPPLPISPEAFFSIYTHSLGDLLQPPSFKVLTSDRMGCYAEVTNNLKISAAHKNKDSSLPLLVHCGLATSLCCHSRTEAEGAALTSDIASLTAESEQRKWLSRHGSQFYLGIAQVNSHIADSKADHKDNPEGSEIRISNPSVRRNSRSF